MSGGDPMNYDENLVTELMMLESEENDYKPYNIIDGYNVHIQQFIDNSDFELSLRQYEPVEIILYEPYLEFMRAIEVYNAERIILMKREIPIQVNLLLYE